MTEIIDPLKRMDKILRDNQQMNIDRAWIHKRVIQILQVSKEVKIVQIKCKKQISVKTILFLNNDMIIRLHYCEYGNDGLDGGWMSTVSSQNRAIPCAAPSVRGEEVQRSNFSYSKKP